MIRHQILAAIPVLLAKFSMGLGIGWIAPMLHRLKSDSETAFTSAQCGWIAAGHYITRALSPALVVLIIDRLGRNATLILCSLIYFVMWIAVYFSRDAYVHFAVRVFFGIGVGFLEAGSAIYFGENCSANVRGIFNALCSAFFFSGELTAFLLAAYLSYQWVAICHGVLTLIALLSTTLLVEPAQYLIMKGKYEKAEKNFDYLYGLQNAEAKKEFADLKQYLNEEKENSFSWRMLRTKEVSRSLRIVIIVNFICLAGGFIAVNSFVTIALANSEGISAFHLTVLYGVAQFMSTLVSSTFMDTFNRRTLFLFSSSLIVITHAATAALYYVDVFFQVSYFNWILFALLTTFSGLNAMFTVPLTFIITGELLPQNTKAIGTSLAVFISSFGGFLGAKIFLPISDAFGVHTNFILFSCLNLFMFLYLYVDLPETKGKTLVAIQRELKGEKVDKNFVESIQL